MSNEYYKIGNIETIDFIEAKLTNEQFIGFLMGNILKYISRCNYKENIINDVEKLQYYAGLLKETLQKNTIK